jgi:hypothetical protein
MSYGVKYARSTTTTAPGNANGFGDSTGNIGGIPPIPRTHAVSYAGVGRFSAESRRTGS